MMSLPRNRLSFLRRGAIHCARSVLRSIGRNELRPYIVLLFLANTAHAVAPEGQWWDVNFAYRQQIDIPSGTAALPTAYAVSVTIDHAALVAAGRSIASGDDVRIVYWDGSAWTELNRIVDPQSTWNASSTMVWFRTEAAIAANVTDDNYYLYFGNAGAGAPPADPAQIFLLYDEFNGNAFDTALWDHTQGPAPTVGGGTLTCPNNCRMSSDASFGVDTIWEARVSFTDDDPGNSYRFWYAADDTAISGDRVGFYVNGSGGYRGESRDSSTGTRNLSGVGANVFRTYAFTREDDDAVSFFIDGVQESTSITTGNQIPTGSMPARFRNRGGNNNDMVYDWVRIRPYRVNEPTLSLGGREQLAPIVRYYFDEASWNGSAGEAVDASASGLDATASGAITAGASPAIAGNPGSCRYGVFDGANDYVERADHELLDVSAQLTAAAWIYPTAYGGELKSIISKDTNFEFHLTNTGNINWWWNDAAGNTRSFTSSGATVSLNQWTHVAITYRSGSQRIYINGVLRGTAAFNGALMNNNWALQVGYDGSSSPQPQRHWSGYIDEVAIYSTALSAAQVGALMNETHPCTGSPPHFLVVHDGYGIHCAAESVTVDVRDASNNPYPGYGQEITLNTNSGRGDWALTTGGGVLDNGAADDGIATYVWSGADTSVTFALSYRQGAPAINIDVFQSNDATIRDDDTEGLLTWTPSGFTITSSPLSNPPPGVIPPFASPQVAGADFPIYITAYGTTPTDATCGVIEGYTGGKNLKFWSTYVDPGTGTRNVTIDGGNIATSEAASAAQAVAFANGQASVTARYSDVGLISIDLKDDTGSPSLPAGIRGGTGNFVVRPANFVLSGIQRTSDSFANPAAATATDAVFIRAGQSFTATVTALDANGVATPNFGQESTPESVALVSTLVLPAGGSNPAVSAAIGFATFTNGVSTGTDFSWPEVGIITLTPQIRDGDYLGAGNVTGTTTGNVGRFIPNSFSTSLNAPQFQTACAAGGFTYLGQPFNYAIAPVTTVTALAANGATTSNYRGAFFKLTNASLTGRAYTAATGTVDVIGAPGVASDPAIADLNNGTATLTYSAGSGLAMSRGAPVAPFDAVISLSQNIIDTDGVTAANPVIHANIPFDNGAAQRYGRIAFRNAVGSELLNLPLPMRAEYFISPAAGFAINGSDTCTTNVTLALGAYGGNLGAGETCILDNGSPGLSAAGCPAPGPVGQRFAEPPLAGDFVTILQAPGTGNDGTVTVTTVVPAWLRFDWNTAVAGEENPSGIATFGIFKGDAKRIFQTEK